MKDKKLLEKGKTKPNNIPTFFNTEDLFKTRNSVVSFKNKKQSELSKSKELFFKKFFEK